MWKRARERLLSGVALVLVFAWLACSVGIAIWFSEVSGIEFRRKGAIGLVLLIGLVPIGVLTAIDEFIIRRIRYGPPAPGRHKRDDLNLEEVRALDQRLRRRPGEH